MIKKITEPSSVPESDLNKSYKKQNELLLFTRYFARTPANDVYLLEPMPDGEKPVLSADGIIEFTGTLYVVSDGALTLTEEEGLTDGLCFIKLKPEGDELHAYITNEKPENFNYELKGFYKQEDGKLVKTLCVSVERESEKYINIKRYAYSDFDGIKSIAGLFIRSLIIDKIGESIYTPSKNARLLRVRLTGGGGGGGCINNQKGQAGGDTKSFGYIKKGGGGGNGIAGGSTGGGSGGDYGGAGSGDKRVGGNGKGYGSGGGGCGNTYSSGGSFGGDGGNIGYEEAKGGTGSGSSLVFCILVNDIKDFTVTVGKGGNGGISGSNRGGYGYQGCIEIEEYT